MVVISSTREGVLIYNARCEWSLLVLSLEAHVNVISLFKKSTLVFHGFNETIGALPNMIYVQIFKVLKKATMNMLLDTILGSYSIIKFL